MGSSAGDIREGGGAASTGPCGACKFLRRKCANGCIFAPYFDSEQGSTQFAAIHKVFGASNVSKLLLHIPVHKRFDAVVTISYEAQSRLREPIYGCVAHIFALQQQIVNLQAELSYLQAHLATLKLPSPPPLLSSSTTVDLTEFFDPQVQMQWQHQHHQPEPSGKIDVSSGDGDGDLHALA